ncbi:MAG: hypothetical protein K6B74_03540, partial [Ruminococcus sp.]|nr:hypothetical protein [Ruminococcus sp.]
RSVRTALSLRWGRAQSFGENRFALSPNKIGNFFVSVLFSRFYNPACFCTFLLKLPILYFSRSTCFLRFDSRKSHVLLGKTLLKKGYPPDPLPKTFGIAFTLCCLWFA